MKFLRYLTIAALLILVGLALWFLAQNADAIPPLLNGLLMVSLPLALGIWVARRYKQDWRLYGIGAATFVLSQVLHIPFNLWLLNPFMENMGWSVEGGPAQLALIGVALGLSSGIFEETARLLVLRRWLKDARSWAEGLMFGAGHGGMEAMLLGAVVIYVFLQFVVLLGASPEALAGLAGADNVDIVQGQMDAYWGANWYDHLLGALERVSAMCFHLSAALLVMKAVVSGHSRWYWAAVGWHALLNGVSVFGLHTLGAYAVEGILLVFAALSLFIVVRLRHSLQEFTPEPPAPAPLEVTPLKPATPSREKIEDSRYD
ncbi:MAG: YhfC family intramembrane metalloprotease [Anaerolineae bacterium]|nr:MAG: YhfC family intramembrane metalloprotease [Anaerolineae bacterium]